MSNPGTNTPSAPAGTPAESALSDGGLGEFFGPAGDGTAAPPAEGAQAQPLAEPAPLQNGSAPAAPVAPAAPAPAPVAAVPQPDTASELAALRAEIARLNPQGARPEGPAGTPPADPLTSVPEYNFQLPPQLMEQLNDPDVGVRSKALSATISATARVVHQQVQAQMQGMFQRLMQDLPGRVTSVTLDAETRKHVTTDFYGAYPEYNSPMLRPMVQVALLEVARSNPALAQNGWTPQLRDALGAYLRANVPLAAKPAAPAPQVPGAKPPAMMSPNARPAASAPLDGNEAALAEMFS